MDFKSLVNRLDQLSEAKKKKVEEETKETPTGRIHKAKPGGYGRAIDTDEEGNEKKKEQPAAKRGRGRPKKDADETGEVKKWDFSGLVKPVKLSDPKGKTMPGRKVTKMADADKEEAKKEKEETKKKNLKDWIDYIDENLLNEAEQISVQPAKQNTQVIKQGTKTLGTVENPQLAQQIKQSIGKGEMTLAGDELGEAEGDYSAKKARAGKDIGKPGKQFSKIAKSAGERYGSKAAGERVAGAVLKNLRKADEGMKEGKFVKGPGGVPSDRYGNPVEPKPPKGVGAVTLRQLEKNKRENPGQSPFKTQDEKVKKYLGLGEQGVAEAAKYRDPKYLGKLHAPDAERQEREREEDDAFNAWVNSTDDFIDPVFQPDIRSHDEKVPLNRQGKPYEKDPLASRKDVRGRKDKTGVKRPFKADLKAAIRQGLGKHNLKGVLPEQGVAEADIPSDQMDMGAGLGAGRSSTTLEGKKAKPDFLDMDKDGNKKESMKKAASDKKKKVNESSHRHSAARLMGKSHALAKEGYNCRYEDMDEAREYHEGFKEGLDECYGKGVYETAPAMPPATVPGMANAAMPAMEDEMGMYEMDMYEMDKTEYMKHKAKTTPGDTFKAFGQSFRDDEVLETDSFFESLDKQLSTLLNEDSVSEGMTVSISKGQQGMPDSVSVTAQDAEADQLLGLIKQAGLGLFGGDQQSSYSADDSAQSHGDIKVVGDHDGMMSIMKKISGIDNTSSDYEEEEHSHEDGETCDVCGQNEAEENLEEVESEDQMEFEVSEDDSEEKETTADEDAEAEEDKDLAIQNSNDTEDEEEKVDESYANSDDDTFEADIHFMTKAISGGLNKQKSTGQTTIPVIPGQNDRMGYSTNESVSDWKKLAGIR
jgi:hypothetical protein